MVPSAGDVFLLTLRNMGISNFEKSWINVSNSLLHQPESIQATAILPLEEESPDLPLEDNNISAYITGYIVRKIRGKVCEVCRKNLQSTLDIHNPFPLQEKLWCLARRGADRAKYKITPIGT